MEESRALHRINWEVKVLSALVIGIRDRKARSQVELESLEKRQATDRSSPPSPRASWESHI